MNIISISLDDKNLDALDDIRRVFGLNGRSEAVRTAINAATIEIEDMEDMKGPVEGVLIVIKRGHSDPWMNKIQAEHVAEIKTQLHSHMKNKNCLEVMIISGDADRVTSMIRKIHASKKADYVRFVRN